ncbi:MAG: cobaltochelatase subunit CobN, partial [Paludibacteraceae bacterium]|nr:cobaltochelatase subunit CobN [Paludibacteraceae bacterium]
SRELRLDTTANGPAYSEDDIERIESFAEEIINEKIVGQLYTLGVPYEPQRITSSVFAMATDPIAYSLLALDKLKGRASSDVEKHKLQFDSRYMAPAKKLVEQLLGNKVTANDQLVMKVAGIGADELAEARKIEDNSEQDLMAMMMRMQLTSTADKAKKDTANKNGKQPTVSELRKKGLMKSKKVPQMSETTFKMMEKTGKFPKEMMDAIKQEQEWYHGPKLVNDSSKNTGHKGKGGKDSVSKKEGMAAMMAKKGPTYTKEQKAKAHAINEIERAIKNVSNYKLLLQSSPAKELASMTNALNGGYTAPSPGGDPIVNPNTLPTGRNLYGINAENTPTEDAWEKGKALAENTISMYRKAHNDSLPRKVSYTLWSGEFIETGGATIAQVLYMLGVEPIRDAFGRVTDIRLIPSKELGRPRIDVVVQTSGQLRDIAASRLFLINRAVEMAAAASDDEYTNLVKEGVTESERVLVEKGVSPKEAREISTYRVFGAQNGGYGTGIQGMVTAGDKWESEKEIAEVYLNNMGAFYGSEKNWESFRQTAFEAALTRTDVVVQPRQSNTWGALSLDHVYEFMGGLNLTVRNVTGKDPDAYMSDYRNHNRMRMQEVKEAIGVESRTTIFNPTYIKEKMKGGASSAGEFSEIITNTYGWNVMKPKAIDKEMWDEIYDTYVKDKHKLGVREFFERENPAALEEMTAVMMETARKGMWKASEQQLADIADLHTQLVNKYKPSCSGFVCDNAKLRQFIAQNTNAEQANEYIQNIKEIREQQANNDKKGTVMKKEDLNNPANTSTNVLSGAAAVIGVVAVLALMVWLVRKRRKNNEGE